MSYSGSSTLSMPASAEAETQTDPEMGTKLSERSSVNAGNGLCCSVRLLVYISAALGTTVIGMLYSSTNFAWVCMINSTFSNPEDLNVYGGELDWDHRTQMFIFAGFSIGSLVMSVPTGYIIERFGSRLAFATGTCIAGLATMLIPVASNVRWTLVFILRIIVGCGCSVFWPVCFNVAAWWGPKSETGRALAIASSGFSTGQFIGMIVDGYICKYLHWSWVYYLAGIVTFVYSIVWVGFYRNNPSDHKLVKDEELEYILANRQIKAKEKPENVPYSGLLTNIHVLSCIICRFTVVYVTFAVGQFTPTYFKHVLNFSETTNGVLSAMPLLCQTVGRIVAGPVSDIKIFTPTIKMKVINTFAQAGSALCALGLAFVSDDTPKAIPVILLCGIMLIVVFITGGFQKAPLAMAPQYSAVISSLMNISGFSGSIIMPFVVAGITKGSKDNWDKVFFSVFGLGLFGALVFILFGSAEKQDFSSSRQGAEVAPQQTVGPPAAGTVIKY